MRCRKFRDVNNFSLVLLNSVVPKIKNRKCNLLQNEKIKFVFCYKKEYFYLFKLCKTCETSSSTLE